MLFLKHGGILPFDTPLDDDIDFHLNQPHININRTSGLEMARTIGIIEMLGLGANWNVNKIEDLKTSVEFKRRE